jgi:hypothetical protein
MKRLTVIAIAGALAWQGCADQPSGRSSSNAPTASQSSPAPAPQSSPAPTRQSSPAPVRQTPAPVRQPPPTPAARPQRESANQFKCDGRQHCSQMSSCAEATFFLKNCPGVKMDGDNDGVPCEAQWCN